MKVQLEQVDAFEHWLSKIEWQIENDFQTTEITLPEINRQHALMAQLQDELVSQQQITESLQNMIIILEDTNNEDEQQTSKKIEEKLLNLSDRWAQICNFVQTRWIPLQELQIELEQIDTIEKKLTEWFDKNEGNLEQIKSSMTTDQRIDKDRLIKQIQSIQVINS